MAYPYQTPFFDTGRGDGWYNINGPQQQAAVAYRNPRTGKRESRMVTWQQSNAGVDLYGNKKKYAGKYFYERLPGDSKYQQRKRRQYARIFGDTYSALKSNYYEGADGKAHKAGPFSLGKFIGSESYHIDLFGAGKKGSARRFLPSSKAISGYITNLIRNTTGFNPHISKEAINYVQGVALDSIAKAMKGVATAYIEMESKRKKPRKRVGFRHVHFFHYNRAKDLGIEFIKLQNIGYAKGDGASWMNNGTPRITMKAKKMKGHPPIEKVLKQVKKAKDAKNAGGSLLGKRGRQGRPPGGLKKIGRRLAQGANNYAAFVDPEFSDDEEMADPFANIIDPGDGGGDGLVNIHSGKPIPTHNKNGKPYSVAQRRNMARFGGKKRRSMAGA